MKSIWEWLWYGGRDMTARQLARRLRRGEQWRPVSKSDAS